VNVCVEPEAIPVISNAGGRHLGRRQLLRGSLVVATFGMVPGCEMPGRRAPNVPRIGFLAVGSREGRAFLIDGFLKGLREHGYVEGQNIRIEYRFSEGRNEKLPELAAELVASRVTLIVASGTPASFAAGQATAPSRSSWEASLRTRSRPVSSPASRGRAATSRE
jgi:ABC transporter substrate binding protein